MTEQTNLVTVTLLGVPAGLFLAHQRHVEELVYELKFLKSAYDKSSLGPELADLITELRMNYAAPIESSAEQARQALRQGRSRVDIRLELPLEAAEVAPRQLELLEQADELCHSEVLLTKAAPPEVEAMRRWFTEELVAQLTTGRAPQPCPLPEMAVGGTAH